MSTEIFSRRSNQPEESQWLSVADLMAGLMIIFMFISIAYMRMVMIERDRIKEVAVALKDAQQDVYEALLSEFEDDLHDWNAEIERQTLTVRFKEPEVLFERGRDDLRPEFRQILDDFFPRYVSVLQPFVACETPTGKPRGCIEEIRIEGHTSSEWNSMTSGEKAYHLNMQLSQGRTQSVLLYGTSLVSPSEVPWLRERLAAVGHSSSRPILDASGSEDPDRSRRVEFRVKTTVEKQLMRVIEDR